MFELHEGIPGSCCLDTPRVYVSVLQFRPRTSTSKTSYVQPLPKLNLQRKGLLKFGHAWLDTRKIDLQGGPIVWVFQGDNKCVRFYCAPAMSVPQSRYK